MVPLQLAKNKLTSKHEWMNGMINWMNDGMNVWIMNDTATATLYVCHCQQCYDPTVIFLTFVIWS